METRFVTIKDGEPSMATPFSEVFITGEALSAGNLVALVMGTTVIKADAASALLPVGFVLTAAAADAAVTVYFVGKVRPIFEVLPVEPLVVPIPVFLGTAGRILLVPASPGIALQVGLCWGDSEGHWLSFAPKQPISLL